MTRAKYICFEGTEGVGKTTQTKKVVDYLLSKGHSVLHTKEPGIDLLPLTMKLREIMLSNEFDDQLTVPSREFISQAIRSIHLEKLVYPALDGEQYDFIIQDRGLLSGLAYGVACGNDFLELMGLSQRIVSNKGAQYGVGGVSTLYDNIVLLKGDIGDKLNRAKKSKQEFESGDAIEAKGSEFMEIVGQNFTDMADGFQGVRVVNVDGKDIDTVFAEILSALELS